MKKKIIIILSITILIVLTMCITRTIIENKKHDEKLKQGIENLSDEARNSLNYDELVEDINSWRKNRELVHATKKSVSTNRLERVLSIDFGRYVGDGYYYMESGNDAITYGFYSTVDDSEIYASTVSFPFESWIEGFFRKMREYVFELIMIIIIIVGGTSCIIVYIKGKKSIK